MAVKMVVVSHSEKRNNKTGQTEAVFPVARDAKTDEMQEKHDNREQVGPGRFYLMKKKPRKKVNICNLRHNTVTSMFATQTMLASTILTDAILFKHEEQEKTKL